MSDAEVRHMPKVRPMRSEPDQIKIWDQASYGNIWKLRNRQKPESAKLLTLRICMGSWEPQWNTQDLSPIRLKRDRSESMQSLLHWCTEKQRHCKVPAVDKESDHWNLSMDQTSEQSDACWVWSLLNQCLKKSDKKMRKWQASLAETTLLR